MAEDQAMRENRLGMLQGIAGLAREWRIFPYWKVFNSNRLTATNWHGGDNLTHRAFD